mmetsp:Transcript_20165/g.37528  ORF Transcript_20165/g.37528 Transcript_20165/m.37528 type:complete len:523 (+) Transcript_20165:23-1591(+)
MEDLRPPNLLEHFNNAAECEVEVDKLIEELVIRGADSLYDHYLDAKNVPFAVKLNSDILVNAIELFHVRQDLGESEVWPEEVEPLPCTIDTWGRAAVPVKKKYKIIQPRPPTSPHSGSVRSHITTITRVSQNLRSRVESRKTVKEPLVEEKQHVPVALPEQTIVVSPEEDNLRLKKELEYQRKQEEDERIRLANEVEEERLKEASKRASDLKSKPFTYDFDGQLMLQRQVKDTRVSFGEPEFKIITEEALPQGGKNKLKRMVSKKELPTVKSKRPPEGEIEFVKNILSGQPPLFDNIKLAGGVSIIEGAKVRKSPKKSKAKTLTRTQYKQLSDHNSMNKTYSSFSSSIKSARPEGFREQNKEDAGKSLVVTSNADLLSDIPDIEEEDFPNQSMKIIHPKSKSAKNLSPITKFVEGMEESDDLSEVDKFNFQLMKNKDWGANPPIRGPPKRDVIIPSRKSGKVLHETLGYRTKLPRERPYIEATSRKTRLAPPPLGKTMGHGLISVQSEILKSLQSLERSLRS